MAMATITSASAKATESSPQATPATPATAARGSVANVAASADAGGGRVTIRSIVHGEWIKFWSVRSTGFTLLAAALASIGFAMIFSATVGSDEATPGPNFSTSDPLEVALGAVNLTQMIVGVLGVMVVAGEYNTGLIRTTIAAVGRRVGLVQAKTIVVAAATAAVMAVGVMGSLWAGQLVYSGDEATLALTDGTLLGVAGGTVVYLTGIALMGLALGFIFRSTAGAIGTLFGGVFIGPGLLSLLPDSFTDPVLKYLPSEAGDAMMSSVTDPDLLSTGSAYLVFGAWVVGLLTVAAVLVQRRDA